MYHFGEDADGSLESICCIEYRYFIFLKVFVVGHWKTFAYGQQTHQIAVYTAGLAAYQFCHVRILFLRHDAAPCREGIVDLDKVEFGRAPQDKLLAETADY